MRTLLTVAFVLGLLSSMLVGMDLSFNVYALSLKKTFNFSQIEVEIVASMGTIGLSFSFILRLLQNTIGYEGAYIVVWLLTVLSSVSYSLAARYGQTSNVSPAVICCVQLSFAIGLGTMTVAITSFAVQIYSTKHSGKILGVYCAVIGLAKIIAIALAEFVHSDLMDFFKLLAILFGVGFGLCLITFYKVVRMKQERTAGESLELINKSENMLTDKVEYNSDENNTNSSRTESGIHFKHILRIPSFHALFWPSTLFYATTYACMNDITSVALAIGVTDPLTPVYVLSISIFTTRAICGLVFDHFRSEICGFLLIFGASVSLIIAVGIGLFFLNSSSVFVMSALVGIAQGVSFTIPASINMLYFGPENYEPIINAFLAVSSMFQIVCQVTSGYSYNIAIQAVGLKGLYCYGSTCFSGIFVISFAAGVINALFALINLLHIYIAKHKTKENAQPKPVIQTGNN